MCVGPGITAWLGGLLRGVFAESLQFKVLQLPCLLRISLCWWVQAWCLSVETQERGRWHRLVGEQPFLCFFGITLLSPFLSLFVAFSSLRGCIQFLNLFMELCKGVATILLGCFSLIATSPASSQTAPTYNSSRPQGLCYNILRDIEHGSQQEILQKHSFPTGVQSRLT